VLELRRQEQRFRSLVQHAADITIIIDADGLVNYASPAIHSVLGFSAQRSVGRSVLSLLHGADIGQARNFWNKLTVAERISLNCVIRARHADGSLRWLDVIATNLLNDVSVEGVVCNARDVTEARTLHQRLHHQASHDGLTQLANRTSFDERLNASHASSSAQEPLAVIMIDLDDFKPINDRYGHQAGDALLIAVAGRLQACIRSQDTVARLGGDEFAIILPGATREDAVEIANRIIGLVQESVLVDKNWLSVNASVGVAVGRTQDASILLRDADAALYVAKRGGKGSFHCGQVAV
jgi:diguanylate cyclase (GGDEF)-like protein/PAS domain S-box-containing protein